MEKNIFIIDGLKIEIRNYKRIKGHDDSLPYRCELWSDNKHFANCFNDGWGGVTQITAIDTQLFEAINSRVVKVKGVFDYEEMAYSLDVIADTLADRMERNNYVLKQQQKHLVFEKSPIEGLSLVPFYIKGTKRKALIADVHPSLIDRCVKRYQKEGYKLLNTNI